MTKELIKKETVEITDFKESDLSPVGDIFDVNDNMKGVSGRIPQIKINHQVRMFTNQDKSQKFETFRGIILHHSPINAYWAESFDKTGGGTPPDCSSMNASTPADNVGKQAEACFKCPQNQFGSGPEGSGKACKNMWRLHVLVENQKIPKRLTIPPSNIGALQDFLVTLRDINVPHELAIVNFSLIPAKSKNGIEYSMIQLRIDAVVNKRDKALELKKLKDDFSAAFQEVIEVEEYITTEKDPQAPGSEEEAF